MHTHAWKPNNAYNTISMQKLTTYYGVSSLCLHFIAGIPTISQFGAHTPVVVPSLCVVLCCPVSRPPVAPCFCCVSGLAAVWPELFPRFGLLFVLGRRGRHRCVVFLLLIVVSVVYVVVCVVVCVVLCILYVCCLEGHERKWDEHERKWDEHERKWDEHERKWDEHERKWDEHERKWDEHERKWDEHERKWDEHERKWDKHERKWDEHERNWKKLKRLYNVSATTTGKKGVFFWKTEKKPGHLIDEKKRHIVEKKGAKKTSLQSVFLYFLKEVVRDPEAYCKQKSVWQFVEKWQVGWQFVEKKPWSWHPIENFFLQSAKAIKTPPK